MKSWYRLPSQTSRLRWVARCFLSTSRFGVLMHYGPKGAYTSPCSTALLKAITRKMQRSAIPPNVLYNETVQRIIVRNASKCQVTWICSLIIKLINQNAKICLSTPQGKKFPTTLKSKQFLLAHRPKLETPLEENKLDRTVNIGECSVNNFTTLCCIVGLKGFGSTHPNGCLRTGCPTSQPMVSEYIKLIISRTGTPGHRILMNVWSKHNVSLLCASVAFRILGPSFFPEHRRWICWIWWL